MGGGAWVRFAEEALWTPSIARIAGSVNCAVVRSVELFGLTDSVLSTSSKGELISFTEGIAYLECFISDDFYE